jgi:hypothetical protein
MFHAEKVLVHLLGPGELALRTLPFVSFLVSIPLVYLFVVTMIGDSTVAVLSMACFAYVVNPDRTNFSLAGGTASFRVDTTPDDCQWTDSFYGVIVTGQSGTGDGSVTFKVSPSSYQRDGSVQIRGLSGQNPPGVHTFSLR